MAETVTLPKWEYYRLLQDAESWRTLEASPHCAELLAEWVEWAYRRDVRATSTAISAAADWRKIASTPTYAELERRRAVPVVPRRCAGPGCRIVLSIHWPAPRHDVFCHGHQGQDYGPALQGQTVRGRSGVAA